MAENSAIEWTTHTFNPWVGCTKISPACDHCYAESWAKRTGGAALWQGERRRTTASNWRLPLKWNAEAERVGVRARVFCASLADVFDNQVPEEWRRDLFDLIRVTPHLDWQLLTKRPQNISKMLPPEWGAGWPNVWLGTTVANQEEADRNVPHLLRVPATKRFLSCEPLLGPINLSHICLWPKKPGSVRSGIHVDALAGNYFESGMPYIGDWDVSLPYPEGARRVWLDWVIVGGESGPGARPMHPVWARDIRDPCEAAGVPFFFKQWGEWQPHKPVPSGDLGGDVRRGTVRIVHPTGQTDCEVAEETGGRNTIPGSRYMARIGKKAAGALLDGREWREMPT